MGWNSSMRVLSSLARPGRLVASRPGPLVTRIAMCQSHATTYAAISTPTRIQKMTWTDFGTVPLSALVFHSPSSERPVSICQ